MKNIDIQQERTDYRLALEQTLQEIILMIHDMPEVEKVILFGSYAAGRRDLFTDLDLIVVMDSDQDFISRTGDLYIKFQPRVDLDLLVYTPEEFSKIQETGFIKLALATGQVIYEKKWN